MIALMVFTALLVYLGIAWLVVKRVPSKKAKWIAVAVFVLIPTWDEILGRIYFKYLCETQGGIKVYKVVELPGEYWAADGKPKFYDDKNGNFYLTQDYPSELKIEGHSSILHIDRLITILRDKEKEKSIAEKVSYMYWGGWFVRNSSPHNTAVSCGNDLEQYGNFIRQVFKPIISSK